MRWSRLTTGFAVALLASVPPFAACAATGPNDPATLLAKAADDTARLQSVRFALLREGDPVLLDAATGARFTRASGEFRAPDRVHATVNATVGSAVLTVEVLWLPEGVFVTDPLTGVYARSTGALAFDAPGVFAPSGMPDVLKNGLRAVTFVASERLDGREAYHLRGEADGDRLKALTGGVLVEGRHAVDLWIEHSSFHVLRLRDRDPSGSGWRLDLSAHDAPVNIERP